MSKEEIDDFIKSTNITQDEYVAPTVKTNIHRIENTPAMVAALNQPSYKQTQINLRDAENNMNIAGSKYRKALSNAYKNYGVDFTTSFQKPTSQKLETENKNNEFYKNNLKDQSKQIKLARNSVEDERKEWDEESNKWKLANYENNVARANEEDVTLWDKTGGRITRNIADLFDPITKGEESTYIDEQGNKIFLPSYNELKEQKVKQSYSDTLAGKAASTLGDILGGGSKILAAGAVDLATGGIGGKSLYWTDMALDNYKNVKNEGFTNEQAIANTIISTGSEFLTEKLLGGFAGKLTGGQASEVQNIFSNVINKAIKNPQVSNLLGSMGSEGLEEFTQDYIGALNDKITLGKDTNIEDLIKGSFYSALVGAGTAGVVNLPSLSRSNNTNINVDNQNKIELNKSNKTTPTIEPTQMNIENKQANLKNENINENIEEPKIKVENKKQEIKHYEDNGVSEKVAKVLTEMPKPEKKSVIQRIKEGLASSREQAQYYKRNIIDKGEAVHRFAKETKNKRIDATYDKIGTTRGEANYDIGVAQTNNNGLAYTNFINDKGKNVSMSLDEIWEGVDPKIANEYLAHYLNVDRYNQTNTDGTRKYVFGESVTDQDSLKRIKQLEKENPKLKQFGKNVWQYGKNQLQNRVESGQISKQQAEQFMKETPHYVRLQRDVESSPNTSLEFGKGKNAKVNKQIIEFKGSNIDILPFKESMAQYTLDTSNSIRVNLFAQELAKTMGVSADGNSISSVDDIMGINPDLIKDNGDGTYSLTFFNNGTPTTIPINQGIYEALQPNKSYDFEKTIPFKGIRKFDNFRKALLTDKNPLFMATNMIKDAFDAPLNSKYPAQFIPNYIKAIKEISTNGKYYQQYKALGGLQNTYFESGEFKSQGSKINPITWIEKGNNAVEQIPRLAEFISTMNKTGDIDQAMYNAAEITTNFKRGGNWSKAANRNGATFLNASIQGFDKQFRNFTEIESPQQATQLLIKVVALGIAPALINDAMWEDDDEYKDLQEYQKDNYYLFKTKNGTWVRIPKGRAVSVIQSAARRTKYAIKGDKNSFKGFGTQIANQIAPNNPLENNIISPFVDVARNKSWSGNPIVSEYTKNEKHPEVEYDVKTDKFSKWLGKEFNYSPKKINYILDQYSGVIGDILLPMGTDYAESKSDDIFYQAFVNPAISKFTTNTVTSSKSQNEFYDALKEAENDNDPKWSGRTTENQAIYKYLYNKNSEIAEIRKKITELQESKASNKEKFEKSLEYQKQINDIAKKAVKESKNVKKLNDNELLIGDKHFFVKDGEVSKIKDETVKKAKEYGLSASQYINITNYISSIKADKDKNGKTISGSKKNKVITYLKNQKYSERQIKSIVESYGWKY